MTEYTIRTVKHFATEAAAIIIADLEEAIRLRGVASIVLCGGGTPLSIYRQLTVYQSEDAPWENVHVFWGDERLVPPDDPGSNYGEAWEALLSHVPVPIDQIYRMKGELPGDKAAADYATQLKEWAKTNDPGAPHAWPRFDVVLMGLGEDGHTTSLFPGSPVVAAAPVITVTADYQGRPAGRVTLTPPVFNDARHIYFLVSGEGKAGAVYNTLHSDDPAQFPARRIQAGDDGELVWLLDAAAASRLDK